MKNPYTELKDVRLHEASKQGGKEEPVNALAFAPDGSSVATGSNDGALQLYELGGWEHNGELKFTSRANEGGKAKTSGAEGEDLLSSVGADRAEAVCTFVERDGQMLVALGDGSGHVSLGDPIRRKPQTQCKLRGEVTALLSSTSYGLLICGSTSEAEGGSGRVVCYDTASSGPELPTIRTMQTPPFKQGPIASGYSLAFAMASKHEAVVTRQGVDVKLVTLEKGEEMNAFDALGKDDEHAFCASVDSSLLACWKHAGDSSQIDFFHLDEIKSADDNDKAGEEKEAEPEQGGKTPEGSKPEEET